VGFKQLFYSGVGMFLDSLCGFTWAAFLKRDVKQTAPSGPGDCVGTFQQIDEIITAIRKAAYFMKG